MATHVKVFYDAGGTKDVEIVVETLAYGMVKDLTRYPDSDGSNSWGDDNRYLQQYTVTGTVDTKAKLEYLKETAQIVMGATYPKIRVYDKHAADYYNDYSPVQFTSLEAVMVTDTMWRVTCTFKW
jgi:hypothetical protein